MIGALIVALLIPLVTIYCVSRAYEKPKNFPPGPPSLPIYGAWPIIRVLGNGDLGKACWKLADLYRTKVLGFYLSIFPCVVINDPALMKEMLYREEFDGRVDIVIGRLRSFWKRLGIFFTDGYFWFVQRRFSLRIMRDYGFGRRDMSLEDVMASEIKEMIDMRVNGPKYPAENDIIKGDLVYLHYFLVAPFMNALHHVFTQMTVPRSDYHILWHVAKQALRFQRGSDDFGGILSLTPSVKDLAPKWSGYKDLYEGNKGILDFFKDKIAEATATQDKSHDRNFFDVYLKKMKEEQKTNDKTTFSLDQLQLICTDYMLPTSTGTPSILTMLIDRMLTQPEIQDRVHEEIDRIVGRDRLPTLDDRSRMPYTEACIREILRYDTFVPMGVPHRATIDTTIGGYDIAENTMLVNNYVKLHFDKEVWGDPENFRPERFIENGKINLSKDKSLPFGAGHRLCPGETFSRQGLFIVFAGLMQAFHVSTADGLPQKEPRPRIQGIVTTIPEMWVRLTPRCSV